MESELPLSQRFLSLLAKMGVEVDVAERAWSSLRSRYSEANRFYHNLDHIAAMLRRFNEVKSADTSIEFAIWYHDVVYDPRAVDNEEKSADFFRDDLGSILPVAFTEKVCRLIMATDHRTPSSGDVDESLIRDIDLSILSEKSEIYHKYAKAIRQEYAHVPDAAYREGRAKVLRKFLENRIFQSDRFGGMEEDARRNIQEELAILDRGDFP